MQNQEHEKPISTLIGKLLRVYTTGERIDKDNIPDRVNIELSKSAKIVNIWMG